jgi:hypothetical protein
MKKSDLNNAMEWLKIQQIDAFIKDGTIYVVCGDSFELELSHDEIIFRAQLYTDSNSLKNK